MLFKGRLISNKFHPSQQENGMHLLQKIDGKNFHGNHPKYNDYVHAKMQKLSSDYPLDADYMAEFNNVLGELMADASVVENLVQNNRHYKGLTFNKAWQSYKKPSSP